MKIVSIRDSSEEQENLIRFQFYFIKYKTYIINIFSFLLFIIFMHRVFGVISLTRKISDWDLKDFGLFVDLLFVMKKLIKIHNFVFYLIVMVFGLNGK